MKKPLKNSNHIRHLSVDSGPLSTKKRAFERIEKSMFVKFLSGTSKYAGIIMNLSEKGMFISTKVTFPLEPELEILIPLKEEILRVHGEVKSVGKAGKIYNGIGVQLLNPTQNYLKFVSNLRTLY